MMTNISKFQRISNTAIICLMLAYQYFSKGDYNPLYADAVAYSAGFLCAIKIIGIYKSPMIHNPFRNNQQYWIILITLGIISILYYFCQNRLDLLMAFFIALAIQNWNTEDFFTTCGAAGTLFFGIHLILFQLGFIHDFVPAMERLTDNGMIYRSALGFSHPNFVGLFIMVILAAALGCKNKVKRITFLVISVSYSLISFSYTDSRTSLYCVIVGCIIFFIGPLINNRLLPLLFTLITIVNITLNCFLSLVYHNNNDVNFFWSQRPRIFYELLQNGIPLYGNAVLKDKYNRGYSIDNFWFNILFFYGLIFLVVIFFLVYNLCRTSVMENNPYISYIVIIYSIYGFTENHVLDYGFSLIAPLMFIAILNRQFFILPHPTRLDS